MRPTRGATVIEQPTTHRQNGVTTAIGILSAVYAATFYFGALLHLGVRVPLGFTVVDEPGILPATIVEGACGTALAVAALAVFARRNGAWAVATAAHAFALGNTIYHRVMVVALVAVLALLLSRVGRIAFRRATTPTVIQSR
jgi:hypothetical protein